MILATFRMMIPESKRAEAIKILTRTVERTRAEPGCLSCHLYIDAQDNSGFGLAEVWRTNEDLVYHIRSEDFRNVLLVAETAMELPEIWFSTIDARNAMETIEQARGYTEVKQ